MATIIPLSTRWTPAVVPTIVEPTFETPAIRPPREVWPLLGTMLATAIAMFATILWHAAPGIAVTTGMVMLVLLPWIGVLLWFATTGDRRTRRMVLEVT